MKKVILDGKYQLAGTEHFPQWLSYENGVSIGDVRVIDDYLYKAWIIERRWFRKDEIRWLPIEDDNLWKHPTRSSEQRQGEEK